MLKFFYSTATCSTIPHIALEEAGIPFEGIEVSWQRNVKVEELDKVNPLGAVPALVVDGQSLTQTPAILEYIAEAKPSANLLAKPGTFERLDTLSWVAFASSDLQKNIGTFLGLRRMEIPEDAKAAFRKAWLPRIEKNLAHVEAHLAGKEFVSGNHFTIADAALFTILGWTKWAEIPMAQHKNTLAYMKRIYARPAVQKVLKAEGLNDYLPN